MQLAKVQHCHSRVEHFLVLRFLRYSPVLLINTIQCCPFYQKHPIEFIFINWRQCPSLASPGGRYLTIPEVGNKRTGRGARLVLPLTPPWNDGNLCLSFRHKLAGHHVGMLQVFVKKGKQYSPAVWGRTGGNGWRHTQITLWGTGLESVSITVNLQSYSVYFRWLFPHTFLTVVKRNVCIPVYKK